jgi:hypothetical protein
MIDFQHKFFSTIGGEIQLKLPGNWQIIDIIRQIHSPYTVSHKSDPKQVTVITFDYPCMPRENITVKVRELANGIERAQDVISDPLKKYTKT